MRVSTRANLSAIDTKEQQETAPPPRPSPPYVDPNVTKYVNHVEFLEKNLGAVTAGAHEMTPHQILQELGTIQDSAYDLNHEIKKSDIPAKDDLLKRIRAVRFFSSRAAVELWHGLTPEGKKELRPAFKKVLAGTPHLTEGLRKESFRYDVELDRFILPNGKVAPGNRLGQERKRLNLHDTKQVERRQFSNDLAERRRAEGKYLKAKEVREVMDSTKPLPSHVDAEIKRPLNPRKKDYVPPAKGKGQGKLGWFLGQEEAAATYLVDADRRFREGGVEEQVAILDKVRDLRSATDAVEAGTMTAAEFQQALQDPEKTVSGSEGIPPLVIGIGAAAVLGIALYFVLKKK
jgi:hypothetical protein